MRIIGRVSVAALAAVTAFSAISLGGFAQEAESDTVFEVGSIVFDSEPSEYGLLNYTVEGTDDNDNIGTVRTAKNYATSSSSLPTSYDVRDNGVDLPVRNQGSEGCCWAFSTIAAAESWAVLNDYENNSVDFSELELAWFAYNTKSGDDTDGSSDDDPYGHGGGWLTSIKVLSAWNGVDDEKGLEYPVYDASSRTVSDYYRGIGKYRLNNATLYDKNDTDAIKQAIIDNGGIQASYYSNDSYYASDGYSYYYPSATTTNHSIYIVGWNDNYSKANFTVSKPSSNGAWLVRNSWGSNSGDDGYYWISYCESELSEFVAYDFYDASEVDNNYTYTTDGTNLYIYASTSYQANVYTVDSNETLKAVSFFTWQDDGVDPELDYTVTVYKGALKAGGSLGTKVASTSGTVTNDGYHTVWFDGSTTLTKGQAYTVVVKLTSPSGANVYAYMEGSASTMTSSSGQSLFSTNGSKWYDNTAIPTSSGSTNMHNNMINLCTSDVDDPDTSTLESLASANTEEGAAYEADRAMAVIADENATASDIAYATAHLKAAQENINSDVCISTVAEWNSFAGKVNAGNDYSGVVVKLCADLDFSSKTFVCAGNATKGFNGIFDGQGHTMSNITKTSTYAGIFGHTGSNSNINATSSVTVDSAAVIRNLVVKDSTFKGQYVGGICAYLYYSTIENCAFYGTLTASKTSGCYIGGIAGYIDISSIESCTVGATSSYSSAKAIAATASSDKTKAESISNCYYSGSLTDLSTVAVKKTGANNVAYALNTFNGTQADSEKWAVYSYGAGLNTAEGVSYEITFEGTLAGQSYSETSYTDIYGHVDFPTITVQSGAEISWQLDGEDVTEDYVFTEDTTVTLVYTVTGSLTGDVDSDGTISMQDVVRLQRYLAKWDVEIDLTVADVDGSDSVDMQDVVRLQRYLANWGVTLG